MKGEVNSNKEFKHFIDFNSKILELLKVNEKESNVGVIETYCEIIKMINSCNDMILIELGQEHLIIKSLIEQLRKECIITVIEADLHMYPNYKKGYKLVIQLGYSLSEINYLYSNSNIITNDKNFIKNLIKYRKLKKNKENKESYSNNQFTLLQFVEYFNDNVLPVKEKNNIDFSFNEIGEGEVYSDREGISEDEGEIKGNDMEVGVEKLEKTDEPEKQEEKAETEQIEKENVNN